MDPEAALIYLNSDAGKLTEDAERLQWEFVPRPFTSCTFRVKMKARKDEAVYWFRLDWPGYPDQEPSIQCVDPETGRTDLPSAWPNCDGARPGDGFCINVSKEGLRRLHPEWGASSVLGWKSTGNPLQAVLYALQFTLLNSAHYHGRRA